MSETFQTRAERMNNCAQQLRGCSSQLRGIERILEYWASKPQDDEVEWLLRRADEFISRAEKKINEKELMMEA